MKDMEDVHPTCKRDGFPKVNINGRWECVAEYLDRCIGNQQVVDLIQRGETVYYIFESGHELPMLCSCCGGPLAYQDLESTRQDMLGRRLEAMSVGSEMLEDGSEVLRFRLEFSRKGLLSPVAYVEVTPEVAAQMRHPARCPYKGGLPARKKHSGKSRRRKR